MSFLTVLAFSLPLFTIPLGTSNHPSTDQISRQARQAVERSLTFLEQEVVNWNKRQNCVSCHNVLPILWSLNTARARGFAVDDGRLEGWTTKSLQMRRRIPDESLAYLILGRSENLTDERAQAYKTLGERLAKRQQDKGTWKPGGQLVLQKRRAKRSSAELSLWSALALASVESADGRLIGSRDRAFAWFKEAKHDTTTEALALHLRLEREYGEPDQASELIEELLSWQNSDGGWGWTRTAASDVLATGQSLYTLGHAGFESSDPAVQNGWGYLVAEQQSDGSWLAESDVPRWSHDFTEQSVYWATAWAIMGLAQTVPDSKQMQE